MVERYLARQSAVTREGRAALLTAGPGAGKSSVVSQLGLVDEGWRRLDADVVKDYLLEDLVVSGRVEDLLVRELADAHPVMPAELASLVHLESVAFIEELRTDCLARGENVVIEGTLSWPPAAQRLLDELVQREYREVRIVDVEVPRVVAHEQALARWWAGRQEGVAGRGGVVVSFPPARSSMRSPIPVTGAVCARPTCARRSTRRRLGRCPCSPSPFTTRPVRRRSPRPRSAARGCCNRDSDRSTAPVWLSGSRRGAQVTPLRVACVVRCKSVDVLGDTV